MHEKPITKKRKKIKNLFVYSSLLLFAAVALTFVYYFIRLRSVNSNSAGNSNGNQVKEFVDNNKNTDWEVYTDEDYNFMIEHPRLTVPVEYGENDNYKKFILFSESKFSVGKGVGVGISEGNLGDDVVKLKADFEQNEDAKLTKEEEVKVLDYKGVQLDYRPISNNGSEPRSIVLFNNGYYTFSISTTPSQIDRAVSSFQFIGMPSSIGEDIEKFCGGIANIACPEGYTCQIDESFPDAGGTCVKD